MKPGFTLAITGLTLVTALNAVARSPDLTVSDRMASYGRLRARMGWVPGGSDKCGLPAISRALHESRTDPELRPILDVVLQRQERQKTKVLGDFRVHYDTTGAHAPAMLDEFHQRVPGTADEYADSVLAVVSHVSAFETGTLGYLPPPQDQGAGGGPEYDIYVEELGNLYGATSPETRVGGEPDGGKYSSYMTIDNDFIFVFPDSNKGMPGLRVTLAHEFHHAVQLGAYGYWSGEIYFYEMTSVWMEDVVYTGVNDYYQYLYSVQSQFRRPDVPFVPSDPYDLIMYSRGIWCHYVAKRHGRDAMRTSWEEIEFARPLEAIDRALQRNYAGLRTAFAEWTVWNYYTGSRTDSVLYYPEGANYPMTAETAIEFTSDARSIDGFLGPLATRYYQILRAGQTMSLIVANINSAAAQSHSGIAFPYSVVLNVNQVDNSFKPTPLGFFIKLAVPDPTNWYTSTGTSMILEGTAFPNPFHSNGIAAIFIPVDFTTAVGGTLSIFSADMNLVHVSTQMSVYKSYLNSQAFAWNGRTAQNEIAGTGVYFYVLDLPGKMLRGKFALIRE